jgi:hypothetical protein
MLFQSNIVCVRATLVAGGNNVRHAQKKMSNI